jgi:copper chaperone
MTDPETKVSIRSCVSEFIVPDMTCGHCEKTISGALTKVSPDVRVKIDLSQKLLVVTHLPDETVMHLLKDLGYTPQKVK